jgi:hypothetical protein
MELTAQSAFNMPKQKSAMGACNMTMSRFGDANEDSSSGESIQQTTQASHKAARATVDETARMAEAAAGASDRAVQAGAEIIQRNAETLQQTIQSGAKLAARITERSADQFGRAMGFSGEEAQKVAHRSTGNIEAIVQSSTIATEIAQRLYGEWVNFARERMERNFNRLDTLMKCHTPQDFVALQSELMRDNVEGFLGYAGRVGEHSVRLADEVKKRFVDAVGGHRA